MKHTTTIVQANVYKTNTILLKIFETALNQQKIQMEFIYFRIYGNINTAINEYIISNYNKWK